MDPGTGSGAGEAGPPDPVARVVAGCSVGDLEGLADRLADGEHGDSTGVLTLADGSRRLGLASRYGAAFEFWQQAPGR